VSDPGTPVSATTPEMSALFTPVPAVDSIETLAAMLKPVMRAIATAVGSHCEVVLHDLREHEMERTIVAIENGHVTGRSVGGPSTNLGLEVLNAESEDHNRFGYPGRTSGGRDLNCSSIYFRDRSGKVIASLCINVDLTALQTARTVLDDLLPRRQSQPVSEVIAPDITTVLDDMIETAIDQVGKPVALLGKPERVEVLRYLEERGAFFVKRSVERTARRLSISKVTAYGYLDEIRNGS